LDAAGPDVFGAEEGARFGGVAFCVRGLVEACRPPEPVSLDRVCPPPKYLPWRARVKRPSSGSCHGLNFVSGGSGSSATRRRSAD